jgi:Tol biopolymer transport system component
MAHNDRFLPITLRLLLVMVVITTICISVVFGSILIGEHTHQPIMAFTSNRSGSDQIYLLDQSIRVNHRITQNAKASSTSAWSSRQALAFASLAPLHISILDSQLTHVSPLSQDQSWNDYQPNWSPSGDLAVTTDRSANWDIMIYPPSQTPFAAPFNTPNNELAPCWWPDGSLSFVSDRDGGMDIYRYDFASHTVQNLTHDPSNDYNPACSANGQLAFTTTRDMNAEIYVMNLKTGETKNVTNNHASDFYPAWLPDGNLSFVSDRDGNREIYVLDMATHQLTNISQNPADDEQPAWTS